MSYEFAPGALYRMPTHFGPSLGPRQGPEGRRFANADTPRVVWVTSAFRTTAEAIERLMPPQLRLDGDPVVTVVYADMQEIEWLAGRGYRTLGVNVPARFVGEHDDVSGQLQLVLWENRADPIITGREELGVPKLYAEIAAPSWDGDRVTCTASWDGCTFFEMHVDARAEAEPGPGQPELYLKYMPATGEPGRADVCCVTMLPNEWPNRRVDEVREGPSTAAFTTATWEQLPTLVHVVNTLAALPVVTRLPGRVMRMRGSKDLGDLRVVR
jgi:Acetoacetate decarboxylase (ADC)